MRIDPLGESAAILRDLPLPAAIVAENLRQIPEILEAYAAFDTVGVIFHGEITEMSIAEILGQPFSAAPARSHMIPVLYDGEDLAAIAQELAMAPTEIVGLHARRPYECRAIGFCPGFAYLSPLPEPLASVPRRTSPRPRVPPGSVAIAAGMTAVYPLERPGGWWLIGRTPLTLVDVNDDYFPIQAGDSVTFVPIDEEEYARRLGERL